MDSAIRASKPAAAARNVPSAHRVPSRAGELVALHPRRDPIRPGSELPTARADVLEEATIVISYGGREFTVRPSMAEVFLRNSRRVLEAGHPELVPLLHEGGVELLLVSPGVAIRVKNSELIP